MRGWCPAVCRRGQTPRSRRRRPPRAMLGIRCRVSIPLSSSGRPRRVLAGSTRGRPSRDRGVVRELVGRESEIRRLVADPGFAVAGGRTRLVIDRPHERQRWGSRRRRSRLSISAVASAIGEHVELLSPFSAPPTPRRCPLEEVHGGRRHAATIVPGASGRSGRRELRRRGAPTAGRLHGAISTGSARVDIGEERASSGSAAATPRRIPGRSTHRSNARRFHASASVHPPRRRPRTRRTPPVGAPARGARSRRR